MLYYTYTETIQQFLIEQTESVVYVVYHKEKYMVLHKTQELKSSDTEKTKKNSAWNRKQFSWRLTGKITWTFVLFNCSCLGITHFSYKNLDIWINYDIFNNFYLNKQT